MLPILLKLLAVSILCLSLASSLAAAPIRVTGTVLDQDGGALSGVRVELLPAYEGYAEAVRRLSGKTALEPVAKVSTDEEGYFEVAAPGSGCFRLMVRKDGLLPMEHALVPLVEDRELPAVNLEPSSSLEVRTMETGGGKPVAGVVVRILASNPWRLIRDRPEGWYAADRSGVSGADGRLVLPWIEREMAELTATSPRYLGQRASVQQGPRAVFPLPSGLLPSRLEGGIEVRGAEGKPAPGALVRWQGLPLAVTGPEGRLEIALPSAESPLAVESREGWRTRAFQTDGGGKGIAPVRLEPPRRISGQVVDSTTRRPVAGALVWSGWPLVAPAVHTDGEGRFQLEVPAGEEIWLDSAAAGFLPDQRRHAKPGAAPVVLKLEPAAAISGIVVDSAGRPVAGARIALDPNREESSDGRFAARSHPDGRFEMTGLKPGTSYSLFSLRRGFARAAVTARTAPAGKPAPPPLRIVMGAGETAFGRTVDESGQPVAGAELFLIDLSMPEETHRATSNEEGRFELRQLSAGRLALTASHPNHADLQLPEVEIPPATPAVDLGDLTLPAGMAIEGRVVDSRGGPIEGVEVRPTAAADLDSMSLTSGFSGLGDPRNNARTGPDGSFRAKGFPRGGRYDLELEHPAYVETTVIGVEAPTKEPLRIEMKAGRALTGQVVGAGGEPIAGASLSWLQEGQGLGAMVGFGPVKPLGSTDPDGRFRITGLPSGSVSLEIAADGYQTRWMDELRIPDDRDLEDLKIVLERGSWLDVRVLNAEGEPVPNAMIFAQPQVSDLQTMPRLSMLRALKPVWTNSQGRVRLSLPEAGVYDVSFRNEGRSAVSVTVTAGPGGTPVELRQPPGFEVSGRVIGEDGAGVAEVYVQMIADVPGGLTSSTGEDGSFVFPAVPDGRYELTAPRQKAGQSDSLDVEVAGQAVRGLELRLSGAGPGADLSGLVKGLPPSDLAMTFVTATSSDLSSPLGRVDRDGRYSLPGLEPGEWTVQARSVSSGRMVEGRVRIEDGATAASLDLDFGAGLTLTGRVLVDGAPLAGADVLAAKTSPVGSGEPTQARTAHDGSFKLRDLTPGPLLLLVTGAGAIGATRTIQLEESGEISIEIVTGSLKVTVFSAAGEPLEGAAANLESLEPKLPIPVGTTSARSGPDGVLEFPRLAAGTYTIEVQKEGFQRRQETVEIRPGGETVLVVRLALH
jgi:Carboxypeptidase regulatory-like domain